MHDNILKGKLQYTSNGTVCDVFKGSAHHGGLGLSLTFSKPRALYPGGSGLRLHGARGGLM